MATENPWFKFYPGLWLGDVKLRRCSPAAHGVWIACLCVMHEAQPRGFLLIEGQPATLDDVAAMCGRTTPEEVSAALQELEERGVIRRDRNGRLFSKRMVSDTKKARKAREIGKMGGNPTLKNKTENPAQDIPGLTPPDNHRREKSQKSQKNQKSQRVERTRAGHVDFEKWHPTEEQGVAIMRQFNLSKKQVRAHWDHFKDQCLAKGYKYKDGIAAWRNWIKKDIANGYLTPEGFDYHKPAPATQPEAASGDPHGYIVDGDRTTYFNPGDPPPDLIDTGEMIGPHKVYRRPAKR